MEHTSSDQHHAVFLSYAEASHLLGVKTGTLYSWVSRRMIPFVRLSPRVVRFRRTDLEEWLSSKSVQPEQAEPGHARR
jgi:excisionase family DNA binding protein